MATSTKRPMGGSSLVTLPTSYVVVDTETTGLSFDWCDLIEIGALKVEDGEVVETFSELIHTDGFLPAFITDLTGITDSMLEDARSEAEVIGSFAQFAGDSLLLAHNANFDMTFLYLAYERNLGRPLTNDFIDTLRVARKALPDLAHHTAEDVCAALGVVNESAHRALPDAKAENECYELMRTKLIEQYGEEGYASLFKQSAGRKLSAAEIVAESEPDENNPLYGMNVVFTGKMEMMVRREAMQALKNIGGNPQDGVKKDTDYLVIGNDGFAQAHQGPSGKMKKAQENELKGLPIRVISEDAFLEMLLS